MDQYQKLWSKLTWNRQKVIQKHWYLLYRIHHNKNLGDYESILSVNPLHFIIV